MSTRSFPARTAIIMVALVCVLIAAAGSCGSPLGPMQDPPQLERPTVEGAIYSRVTPQEGYIQFMAIAVDAAFQVNSRSSFPITVSSSSGDSETAHLQQQICGPTPNVGHWMCDELVIRMHPNDSVHRIYPDVRALGGRLKQLFSPYQTGGVKLFQTSVPEALLAARRWPGVESADYNQVGWLGEGSVNPDDIAARSLKAAIRMDLRSPVAGNGILEAARGDTVSARYNQPDGAVLEWEVIVPLTGG